MQNREFLGPVIKANEILSGQHNKTGLDSGSPKCWTRWGSSTRSNASSRSSCFRMPRRSSTKFCSWAQRNRQVATKVIQGQGPEAVAYNVELGLTKKRKKEREMYPLRAADIGRFSILPNISELLPFVRHRLCNVQTGLLQVSTSDRSWATRLELTQSQVNSTSSMLSHSIVNSLSFIAGASNTHYWTKTSYQSINTYHHVHEPGEAPEGINLVIHDLQYRSQQVTHTLNITWGCRDKKELKKTAHTMSQNYWSILKTKH